MAQVGKSSVAEGAYNQVSAFFYRSVIQAVLVFGLDSLALLYAAIRTVERTRVVCLHQITGNLSMQQYDGSWETLLDKEVLLAAGMHLAATYVGRWQAMVAQWVALRPLLDVFTRETGYKGVVRKIQPWWRQGTTVNMLSTMLEESSRVGRQMYWD